MNTTAAESAQLMTKAAVLGTVLSVVFVYVLLDIRGGLRIDKPASTS
jgi:hypothetical protein